MCIQSSMDGQPCLTFSLPTRWWDEQCFCGIFLVGICHVHVQSQKYRIVCETVYMTSLIHHHTLSTHVCTRLTCGYQLQHIYTLLHKQTTVVNSYMDFPYFIIVPLSTSIYHTSKISALCLEVQLHTYHIIHVHICMIYTPLTLSHVLGFAPLSSNTLTVS